MMTNDAAERLRSYLRAMELEDGYSKQHLHNDLDKALAAERRATVERIRGAVTHNDKLYVRVDLFLAILDAEAER
jgi:hypothetical protein